MGWKGMGTTLAMSSIRVPMTMFSFRQTRLTLLSSMWQTLVDDRARITSRSDMRGPCCYS